MTTFIFVRHGNTNKPVDKNADDLARTLTDKGREQARALGDTLKGLKPDSVICSEAPRAVQTANEALGEGTVISSLPELYLPIPPADRDACNAHFAKLGYASPREYLKEDADMYRRYGARASGAIRACLTGGERTVMIVGHAVLLTIVAHALTGDESALDKNLGEAEHFVIEA